MGRKGSKRLARTALRAHTLQHGRSAATPLTGGKPQPQQRIPVGWPTHEHAQMQAQAQAQMFESRLPTRVDDMYDKIHSIARVCRVRGLLSMVWGSRSDAVEGVINTGRTLSPYAKSPEPDEFAQRNLAGMFDRCAPFFVDARLQEIIEADAPTVPSHARLRPQHFKAPHGCLLFAHPVRNMPPRRLFVPDDQPDLPMFEPAPLSGFAWDADNEGAVLVFIYSWGADTSTPSFRFGVDVSNIPLSVVPWSYAESTLGSYIEWHNSRLDWTHEVGDTNNPTRFAMSARIAVATLLLMDQTLVRIQTTPIDRAARKRAQKAGWTHEPTVQVITLRKVENIRVWDAEPVHVEWRWRWHVRSHWRTLKRGTPDERTVLVHEHLKGPEGKPIKPPRPTMWAVVR